MISIASLSIKKKGSIVYSIQLKLNGFEFKIICYWKIHIFIKLLSNFLSLRKMRFFFQYLPVQDDWIETQELNARLFVH
jgi:hypothetical protein